MSLYIRALFGITCKRYGGTIRSFNLENKTYDILFDDGDEDDNVPEVMVRQKLMKKSKLGSQTKKQELSRVNHPYESKLTPSSRSFNMLLAAATDINVSAHDAGDQFLQLSLENRVRILKVLCDYHLFLTCRASSSFEAVENDDLRVEPFGYYRSHKFFYFPQFWSDCRL